MSNYGFRQKDPLGNIIFDTDKRLIRVLHVERVLANSPVRTIAIPGMRADRAWWLTQCDRMYYRGPVAGIADGVLTVQGGLNAGTTRSDDGYVIVIGYG